LTPLEYERRSRALAIEPIARGYRSQAAFGDRCPIAGGEPAPRAGAAGLLALAMFDATPAGRQGRVIEPNAEVPGSTPGGRFARP
jgi:hypothetical protein